MDFVINGVLAGKKDVEVFFDWYRKNKIEVLFARKNNNFINIITN